MTAPVAVVALGSNLGDRAETLDAALADLGVTGGPQIEMLRRRLRGGAPSMAIRERSVRRGDASAPTGKRR